MSDHAKHAVDTLSVGALIATLLDMIPQITAGLVLLWTVMRMYDTWLSVAEKRASIKERKQATAAMLRKSYERATKQPATSREKELLDKLDKID